MNGRAFLAFFVLSPARVAALISKSHNKKAIFITACSFSSVMTF
jgi:hypothetical protein